MNDAAKNEDRAALITSPGSAAIAVVRIAGDGVKPFLQKHFDRPVTVAKCVHGTLRDETGRTIDDPIVVLDHDSDSTFLADVNLHGGPWVVQATLDLLERFGFRVSHETAFQDTFASGATEFERELNRALPGAASPLAIRSLLAQPKAWKRLAEKKLDPAALSSIAADNALWSLLNAPTVAIVGEANVGKSTLANRLFQRNESITADLPGTTRDWVESLADIDGLIVRLIDTPGLRESSDAIEQAAIKAALPQIARADLLLRVTEQNRVAADLPVSLKQVATIRVINKCDQETNGYQTEEVEISAINGNGLPALRIAMLKHFGCDHFEIDRPRWWTMRQRDLLREAIAVGSVETIARVIA